MSLTFCERTLYHRCTEQTSPATFVLSTRAADSSICLLGVRLKPASFFAHPGFGTELVFLRTHGGSAFPLVLSRGSPSPAAPQYVQAAEPAAARAASARTQQDSGPGWEPSRRPRAGAGRWSRVFRPRSVQLGWETAQPGGGAPSEFSAAAAPQCSREKQRGGQAIEGNENAAHWLPSEPLPGLALSPRASCLACPHLGGTLGFLAEGVRPHLCTVFRIDL